MERYLHIIQEEIPTVSNEDLYLDIKKSSLNSLELLMVRGVLERYFNLVVPDEIWYSQKTLEESLRYFHENFNPENISLKSTVEEVEFSEKVEIRMPQMSNEGLSESWLLKYLGDFHWNLISKGFSKTSSQFFDIEGQRLYATFVRINYELSALSQFVENELISFIGKMDSFGKSTLISNIYGKTDNNYLHAKLFTVFSVKSESANVISKARMDGIESKIPQLINANSFISDYSVVKKGLSEVVQTQFGEFNISGSEVMFEIPYRINPFSDINGVGLLYFASYPMISDACLLQYEGLKKYDSFSTVFRDVFYFGNCSKSEIIIFRLNFLKESREGLKIVTSLLRQSDNELIAKIITVKK